MKQIGIQGNKYDCENNREEIVGHGHIAMLREKGSQPGRKAAREPEPEPEPKNQAQSTTNWKRDGMK